MQIDRLERMPMAQKMSLEAVDRTLKDLRDNQNIFGGAMILLSGDFRQTHCWTLVMEKSQ